MRGNENKQQAVSSFESLEEQVPADHPLRPIRRTSASFNKLLERQAHGTLADILAAVLNREAPRATL